MDACGAGAADIAGFVRWLVGGCQPVRPLCPRVCTQAKLSPTDPIKAEGDAMITMPRVCMPRICSYAASLMQKPPGSMGGNETPRCL